MKTLTSIYEGTFSEENLFITRFSEDIQQIELVLSNRYGVVFVANISYNAHIDFDDTKRYTVFDIVTTNNYSFNRTDEYKQMIYEALDNFLKKEENK